ncbi:MAG: beta-ketoacyl-ACP synthase III [Planctomycetota bacterium]|jgi:3-oxoacyl-[acyl-carrier-protein] synthase-3
MTSPSAFGVRLAGFGSAVPDRVLTNHDLEKMLDTSDEWIVQRTGIRERRVVDQACEGTFTLGRDALQRALEDARMPASQLDLIIFATVTAEMTCPSNACRVAAALGAVPAPAFDLVAACSGFLYGLNVADSLIRSGDYQTIGVIGCDTMSTVVDFGERSVSILFGDAAGAVVATRDDNPEVGCLYQSMYADGGGWQSLYMPRREQDIPDLDRDNPIRIGCLRMHGREIFKFGVNKLRELIAGGLEAAGLSPSQISQFICHQSNQRLIESAREKLGLPAEKFHINIDRYGNSSAGSVGLCLDQLWKAGTIKRGDVVMLVVIGGGLTWANSVWRL